MGKVLDWAKGHFTATTGTERPYECAACSSRYERQPHVCSTCGSYQIDWTGWREEYLK